MNQYQKPEAQVIKFALLESITDQGAQGGTGVTSNPFNIFSSDAHDAAHDR